MLRWSVLLVSVLLNLPVLWDGLMAQQISLDQVLVRFLITVPVIAILLTSVRAAFNAARTQGLEPADDGKAGLG